MGKTTLKIGTRVHEIAEVTLSSHHQTSDGEHLLTVNLFADSRKLAQAGFAINSLTLRGLCKAEDIQGVKFARNSESDDELNDLMESVICEPGQVLELDSLSLAFGRLSRGKINIAMQATCHAGRRSKIPVTGTFPARVDR